MLRWGYTFAHQRPVCYCNDFYIQPFSRPFQHVLVIETVISHIFHLIFLKRKLRLVNQFFFNFYISSQYLFNFFSFFPSPVFTFCSTTIKNTLLNCLSCDFTFGESSMVYILLKSTFFQGISSPFENSTQE